MRRWRAGGYEIADPDQDYWFAREWDDEFETWLLPSLAGGESQAARLVDEARTVRHALGFVPIVWIRNLPGASSTGDPSDGACTFRAAVETSIEIDYQLSQAGRGLKYSSDPTLLIKEPASIDAEIVRSAGQRPGGQREGRREAARDRRHRLGRRHGVCARLAGAGARKRAWQPGERRPAHSRSVRPRAWS